MSKLSFENIDRWLFEWGEGNLSPKQIEELQAFLDVHPELAPDVDSWDAATVSPENVTYPNVSALAKDRKIAPFWMGVSAASFLFIIVLGSIWFFQTPTSAIYAKTEIDTDFEKLNKIYFSDLDENPVVDNSQTALIANENGVSPFVKAPMQFVSNTQRSQKKSDLGNTNPRNVEGGDKFTVGDGGNSSSRPDNAISEANNETNRQNELDQNTYANVVEVKTFNENVHDDQYANVVASLTKKDEDSNNGENDFTYDDVADNTSNQNSSSKGSEKSAFDKFTSKVNSFTRKVKRMADNPVALTNSKDPIYLIPGKLPSDISFSSAGNLIAPRVQAQSRIQWLGQKDQQLMNRLSADGYVYALRGGVGVDVTYNNFAANTIQNFEAAITYSPKFSVNKHVMFEPAVRFKMGNDRIAPSESVMGSQIEFERRNIKQLFNEGETPIGSNLWYRDLGFGATLHTKWFFAGANVDNTLSHSNNIYSNDVNSESRAPLDFNATIGTEYLSRRGMLLSTYATYQNYGELNELWLGANLTVASIFFGAAVNSNLEPAASVGVKTKSFMFLYGADYMKNSVDNNSYLSHQVTMRARFKPSPMNRRFLKI